MKHHLVIPCLAVLAACFPAPIAHAVEDIPQMIYGKAPIARIEPLQHTQYSMMKREMQRLIASHGNPAIKNNFCVSGYIRASGNTEVLVIWKEKGWIIRWWGGDPEDAKRGIRYAESLSFSRTIDMATDLYESDVQLSGTGSYYRVGAEAAVADCETHGKHYVIDPFTMPTKEDEDECYFRCGIRMDGRDPGLRACLDALEYGKKPAEFCNDY
jgi:hypothetical protein